MSDIHIPVLAKEVVQYLHPVPGKHYIDATADGGGHAVQIAERIQPSGQLLAIEWDEELIPHLEKRFESVCSPSKKNCISMRASYTELERIVSSLTFKPVAGVLFDLGFSSYHIEGSKRGFSFRANEPLDMRYAKTTTKNAVNLLRELNRKEIENILKKFGEEHFAKAIAKHIVEVRVKRPIRTTEDLVEVIREAVPAKYRNTKIHYATRTFQALRIAVNHELENIEQGLHAASEIVAKEGRIVVISFHSLEDRIVKQFFKKESVRDIFVAITKKPVTATSEEIKRNPRSASAKLRVFQRI